MERIGVPMSRECAHTNLVGKFKKIINDGAVPQPSLKNLVFCGQCQEWVDYKLVLNRAHSEIERERERNRERFRELKDKRRW